MNGDFCAYLSSPTTPARRRAGPKAARATARVSDSPSFPSRSVRYPLPTALLLTATLLGCHKKDDPVAAAAPTYLVRTLAGTGTSGRTDGPGSTATFAGPGQAALDAQGNLYVADTDNHCVRKVTPAGVVSTLAGRGTAGYVDGPAATAAFSAPTGVAVDGQGTVYVADAGNNCIRAVSPAGTVSTRAGTTAPGLQDGPAATALFWEPTGLACDPQGTLYVADARNERIRQITAQGVVSTLAGSGPPDVTFVPDNFADGPAAAALFYAPSGVAVDARGAVYVADYQNNRVRKIAAGVVSTVAGSTGGYAEGVGSQAQLYLPTSLAVDASGVLYVADWGNGCLRRIAPTGQVRLLAGNPRQLGYADGPAATALFSRSVGIAVRPSGAVLYVADSNNRRIRQLTRQ
jgi:serine/threonine protein kinase, bacterial